MRHLLIALLLVVPVASGCSKEEDPHKLVAEANALLVKGGIEDSKTRALAEQKYDRAIRIICGTENLQCVRSGEGGSPGTDAHSLAHAHFGLAFARSFDLVERVEQLYSSGVILRPEELATVGDGSLDLIDDEGEDEAGADKLVDQCKQQVNLPQLVPLLKTIVDTSLLPIVADLQAVTNYPLFEIEYEKAFLDFGFVDSTLGADEQLGIEFGQVGGVNAKFTVAEAYAALAVFRLVTVAAEALFSFQDLTQAAIVFLPKVDFSGGGIRPYTLARVFNSDPCMANPLSSAVFGVLSEAGRDTFSDIEQQLTKLFEEQSTGFKHIAEVKDTERLIDYSGSDAWAKNLLGRVRTGNSSDDTQLQTVGKAITALLSPEETASAFDDLHASITGGAVFDLTEFVAGNEDLAFLFNSKKINLGALGIPAISFKRFFENPVSDLKSIFPLTYAESEPAENGVTKDGYSAMLPQDKPVGQKDLSWIWNDVNGDGHFNQKGDFIVQTEREAFLDRSNNDDPTKEKDADLLVASGILGTFWDADRNGVPDEGFAGIIPGASGASVTYATGKLWASDASATTEDESYRNYFFSNLQKSNGCLDYRPLLRTGETVDDNRGSCELEVGQALGHVWPNIFPEEFAAVTTADTRRRDPANGVVDRMYMFFPNPSINGAFQIKDANGDYRQFANEDINRFVSGLLTLDTVVTKLTTKN